MASRALERSDTQMEHAAQPHRGLEGLQGPETCAEHRCMSGSRREATGRGGGHGAKLSSERAGEVRPTGRDRSRGPTEHGGDVVSEPSSHVT